MGGFYKKGCAAPEEHFGERGRDTGTIGDMIEAGGIVTIIVMVVMVLSNLMHFVAQSLFH